MSWSFYGSGAKEAVRVDLERTFSLSGGQMRLADIVAISAAIDEAPGSYVTVQASGSWEGPRDGERILAVKWTP